MFTRSFGVSGTRLNPHSITRGGGHSKEIFLTEKERTPPPRQSRLVEEYGKYVTPGADTERMAEPATTKIHQGFSYRLDPTPEQRRLLAGHMGAARFCHNFLLGLVLDNWEEARVAKEAGHEVTKEHYLGTRQLDLQRLWYERRHEATAWYQENSSSTYNYAQLHLARAFTNFYQGRSRVPKFKRKGRAESFTVASGATRLVDSHHVRLSRIGEIKTYESMRKLHRHLSRGTGRVTSVTISERRGQYHLAFSVEVIRTIRVVRGPERVIGVDVGISTLYTGATPEGEWVLSVANPRNYQKKEQRLARAQRRASRRQGPRGGVAPSNRWKRQRPGATHSRRHHQRPQELDPRDHYAPHQELRPHRH